MKALSIIPATRSTETVLSVDYPSVILHVCLFDRCGVYKHQQKRFAAVACRVQDTSKLIVHAKDDDGTKSLLVSRAVLLVAELLPVRLYLDSGIVTVVIRR